MVMHNMCFISSNKQPYVNNRHVNKHLVNSEYWSLYKGVTNKIKFF